MPELVEQPTKTGAEAGVQPGQGIAQDTGPTPDADAAHTQIKGRFNQYMSAFWGLAIPMLSARYLGRWVSNLRHWHESENFFVRRAYGFFVGAVMLGVTSLYAKRTLDDMKRVFGQTVGWEMGKEEGDKVGVLDLWKSKNTIVHSTMRNFVKYNVRRFFFANLPFFNFLIPGVLVPSEKPGVKEPPHGMSMANSVDLGVGTTGLYLASDVITRKETFFERLQLFIDQKINHTDKLGDLITSADLINLFERHARESQMNYTMPMRMDSPEWQRNEILFGRIADLMNQTYNNVPKREHADFTVPKLLYLLGEQLINPARLEESLTYIEVANRYGIPAVKEIQKAMKSGVDIKTASANYPVTLCIDTPAADAAQEQQTNFAGKYAGTRRDVQPPSATFAEDAARKNDMARAAGV